VVASASLGLTLIVTAKLPVPPLLSTTERRSGDSSTRWVQGQAERKLPEEIAHA
jgi:hypothetical protein